LADIALWIVAQDQSKWLRQYELPEICDLLLRHRGHVHVIATGATVLGVGIGAPHQAADTIHVVFITATTKEVLARFVQVLKAKYPWAKYISYVRRGRLGKCPTNKLKG